MNDYTNGSVILSHIRDLATVVQLKEETPQSLKARVPGLEPHSYNLETA